MHIVNSTFHIDKDEIKQIKKSGYAQFPHQLLSYMREAQQVHVNLRELTKCSKELIRHIGQAFKETQVTVLNLDRTIINEHRINKDNLEYVIELIQAFRNTPITKLNLSSTDIQENVSVLIQALRNTEITSLNLTNNGINDEHILALGEALQGTKIKNLYLNNNQITKHAALLVQALQNTFVTTLSLSNNVEDNVGFINENSLDESVHLLAQALQNSQITHLYLRKININKNSLFLLVQALRQTKITLLDLSNNNIGEHLPLLVQALQGSRVTTLDLSYNCILKHAPLLAQSLQGTQVANLILVNDDLNEVEPTPGASSIQAFAQALQGTKVTTLNFSRNRMRATAITLVQSLKDTPVTALNLTNNFIDDETMLKMMPALIKTNIHTLILDDNALNGHSWITELKNTKIHTLSLVNNDLQDLESLAKELTHTSIKCINVRKYVRWKELDLMYIWFDLRVKPHPNELLIQQVTLANCKRDYIHRLSLAEYHASILKELYQAAFPLNTRLFPPQIACLIATFLGYGQDKNLLKRFLNTLKTT